MTYSYLYHSMWQASPASTRDLLDYLEVWLFEDLTDEQFSRGVDYLNGVALPNPEICTIDDCGKPRYALGLCNPHYQQHQRRRAKQRD